MRRYMINYSKLKMDFQNSLNLNEMIKNAAEIHKTPARFLEYDLWFLPVYHISFFFMHINF